MAAPEAPGSAQGDYATVRAAARAAATAGWPLAAAWLSRGDGADLELITMAPAGAPARRGKHAAPGPGVAGGHGPAGPGVAKPAGGPPLLFPPGARAEPAQDSAAELDRLVWVPCLAVPEPEWPAGAFADQPEPAVGPGVPGVFETALIALMRRPFGWLVVAEPTDLLAAETAGRWRVRVLAGASTPDELDVLAPLLAGAAELGSHPYRLRHTTGSYSLNAALAARYHDPVDGAESPFFVTAGTLTALAGLPRASLPGLEVVAAAGPPPAASAAGPLSSEAPPAEILPAEVPPEEILPAEAPAAQIPPTEVLPPEIPPVEVLPAQIPPAEVLPAEAPPAEVLPAGGPLAEAPADPGGTIGPLSHFSSSDHGALHHGQAGLNGSNGHQNGSSAAAGVPSARPLTLTAPSPSPAPAPEDPDPERDGDHDPETGGNEVVVPDTPATRSSIDEKEHPVPVSPVPDVTGLMIEFGAPAEPDGEPVRVPMSRLRGGVLVAGCAGSGTAQTVRHLLAQAAAAGLPWLLVDPAGPGDLSGQPGPATVLNPVDPDAVPLTISPLAPSPGFPLQAHLALAGSLLDVALGADETLSALVAQALRQAYRAAGWDLVTGRPVGPAQPPVLRDLHVAVREQIARSGGSRGTRSRLRGTVDARFGAWRSGAAGRFLDGGHPAGPAELGELLRRRVVLATGDLAETDRALVTGTLLIRLAGHLRAQPPVPSGLRHLLVLAEARTLLRDEGDGGPRSRAAERFAVLIQELAAAGTGTVLTERRPALLTPDLTRDPAVRIAHRLPATADRDAIGAAPLAPGTAVVLADGIAQPVRTPPETPGAAQTPDGGPDQAPETLWSPQGRRSAACGRSCRTERPCRLTELRGAEQLAGSADQAWLRVWGEILTLAVLTDNPLPAVPAPLRRRWRGLTPRTRECALSHVLHGSVGRRTRALRDHYDPAQLTGVLAATATRRLDQGGPAAVRPGPAWVVPPLRWLHELERLCPLGGAGLAPGDHAPPLDFDLPGLPDWPGIRIGQRIRALRRHPLSMDLTGNRQAAWTALVGESGPEPFADDLAQVLPGVDAAQALRHTAGLLEVSGGVSGEPGWLEAVLSWPRRFVVFSGDRSRPVHAADGLTG